MLFLCSGFTLVSILCSALYSNTHHTRNEYTIDNNSVHKTSPARHHRGPREAPSPSLPPAACSLSSQRSSCSGPVSVPVSTEYSPSRRLSFSLRASRPFRSRSSALHSSFSSSFSSRFIPPCSSSHSLLPSSLLLFSSFFGLIFYLHRLHHVCPPSKHRYQGH